MWTAIHPTVMFSTSPGNNWERDSREQTGQGGAVWVAINHTVLFSIISGNIGGEGDICREQGISVDREQTGQGVQCGLLSTPQSSPVLIL